VLHARSPSVQVLRESLDLSLHGMSETRGMVTTAQLSALLLKVTAMRRNLMSCDFSEPAWVSMAPGTRVVSFCAPGLAPLSWSLFAQNSLVSLLGIIRTFVFNPAAPPAARPSESTLRAPGPVHGDTSLALPSMETDMDFVTTRTAAQSVASEADAMRRLSTESKTHEQLPALSAAVLPGLGSVSNLHHAGPVPHAHVSIAHDDDAGGRMVVTDVRGRARRAVGTRWNWLGKRACVRGTHVRTLAMLLLLLLMLDTDATDGLPHSSSRCGALHAGGRGGNRQGCGAAPRARLPTHALHGRRIGHATGGAGGQQQPTRTMRAAQC
jgi:hypothetical protein